MAERNYKREYAEYHSKPLQKKRRANRNSAPAKMVKAGKAHKGDGLDTDHKNRNEGGYLSNRMSNLRMQSPKKNRARND